jgi:hypothetical protein
MTSVQQLLGLRVPPIAIRFEEEPPSGIASWDDGEAPSGCTFWQAAQTGRTFSTVPSDHFNCAIGCYTHAISLPDERAAELSDALNLMVESNYLEMSEVPGIPRLEKAPGAVV